MTGGDAVDLAGAGEEADRLGVPLLVSEQGGTDPLQAELDRLGVTSVLTVGTPAGDWETLLDGLDHTSDPAALPEFRAAGTPSNAVVLTEAGPAAAAVQATARAAGATVAEVPGGDPRADSRVIKLLHERSDAAVFGAGDAFGSEEIFAARTAAARTGVELPGGGQTVFPGRRLVALYGHPSGGSLGVLGEQGVGETIQRARDTAAQYQPYSDEPVVPALEIIATVATADPGPDGTYSSATEPADLEPWIDAAEDAGVYVVLVLQPGRSTFLEQAKIYTDLLKRPGVGLALDAEWRLAPGQRHMEQIGSVDASEINAVSDWLATLTRDLHLPQKTLLLHQFNSAMITNRGQLDVGHDELAVSLHADGHGTAAEKLDTWNTLLTDLQPQIHPGWKNFYDEDSPTMTPEETFTGITPKPWFVSYQ